MASNDSYIQRNNIPDLLECLVTALLYEEPEDPILFMEGCLSRVRSSGLTSYQWDQFNHQIVKQPAEQGEQTQSAAAEGEGKSCQELLGDKLVVFVLGGPGSGKGTQCSRIVAEFGLKHISAGDLLREEVAKGTEQGEKIKEIMAQGKLVQPEITVNLLKQAMLSNKDSTTGFLIDGFPRELSQSKIFEEQVCEGTMVLSFEASDEVMMERLLERGKTSGRVDDNEASIRKRLTTHQEATVPVVDYFEKLGKARKVNADRSVDEVYSDVQALFKDLTAGKSTDATAASQA